MPSRSSNRPRPGPLALLVDARAIHLLAGAGRTGGGGPELLGTASVAADLADDEALPALADAARGLLEGLSAPRITLGLAGHWLDHLLVESPALRGVDAVALVQREVLSHTSLPHDDLTFAEAVLPALGQEATRRRRNVRRLVAAARESRLLDLARSVRRTGIAVAGIFSATALALTRFIRESSGAGAAEPTALVYLRRDGFAIAVHEGLHLHQFRPVSVALPEAVADLALALSEELRRSSIFFRECTQGRNVARARILGRFAGDGQELARQVARDSGLETLLDGGCAPDGDLHLEARALLEARDRLSRGELDLLPREVSVRRRAFQAAAAGAVLVAGLLLATAHAFELLGGKIIEGEQLAVELDEMEASLWPEQQAYDAATARTQTYVRRRDDLRRLVAGSVDHGALLERLAGSVPPDLRIETLTVESRVAGPRVLSIEGRVASDEWEFDRHLARFVEALHNDLGLVGRVAPPGAAAGDEGLLPFRVACDIEVRDEPAGS